MPVPASSVDAVHRSQSSSGQKPLPPSAALTSVGRVGATTSSLANVVAVTTLLSSEVFPDGSVARTLNSYDVDGSSWRTHALCTAGRGFVPAGTLDATSSLGTPFTRIS